jgi:hypothetical protein
MTKKPVTQSNTHSQRGTYHQHRQLQPDSKFIWLHPCSETRSQSHTQTHNCNHSPKHDQHSQELYTAPQTHSDTLTPTGQSLFGPGVYSEAHRGTPESHICPSVRLSIHPTMHFSSMSACVCVSACVYKICICLDPSSVAVSLRNPLGVSICLSVCR